MRAARSRSGNERDGRGRSLRFYKNASGNETPEPQAARWEKDGWIFLNYRGDVSRGGGN